MNLKNVIIAFLFLAFFYCFFILKKTKKKNFLIVGTSANFYPFEFFENKKLKGFDIDLINLISKKIGMNLTIRDMNFDSLILDLINGNVDLIISAIAETPERKKAVFFSEKYLKNDDIIAVSLKNIKINDLSDLSNKKIVINEGYSYEKILNQKKKIFNYSIKTLGSIPEALIDLENKKSDFFVTSKFSLGKIYENKEDFNFYNLSKINFLKSEGYSILVSKKNPELLEKINLMLNSLNASGEIEDLKIKWGLV